MTSSVTKQINFGIIGIGTHASYLIKVLLAQNRSDVDLVAVCDLDRQQMADAEKLVQKSMGHALLQFTDYRELIQRPEINVVIIAVPDFLHHPVAMTAIKAGKHIFLEKPVGINLDQMLEIVTAAKNAGIVFETGYVLRYTPFYSGIKQFIAGGELGRPLFAQALEQFYGGAGIYFRGWWRFRKNTGGLMLTKVSHDLDLMCWFFGKPKRVVTFSGVVEFKPGNWDSRAARCSECTNHCPYYTTPAQSRNNDDSCLYNTDKTGADIVDHAQILVEFESGLNLSLGMNFFNSKGQDDRHIRIIGSNGELTGRLSDQMIRWDPRHDGTLTQTKMIEFANPGLVGHAGGNERQLEEFVDALIHKKEAKAGLESAYWGSLLVMGAQISADTNQIVDLVELAKKYPFPM
jgi:predicted dehydrogenase